MKQFGGTLKDKKERLMHDHTIVEDKNLGITASRFQNLKLGITDYRQYRVQRLYGLPVNTSKTPKSSNQAWRFQNHELASKNSHARDSQFLVPPTMLSSIFVTDLYFSPWYNSYKLGKLHRM
jgi:hypothetical protein